VIASASSADACPVRRQRGPGHRVAPERHFAAGGPLNFGDDPQQGGLATARGSDQRHGTPAKIADEMGQRHFKEGCEEFNIMFPYAPEGLEDFVDKVVPVLRRRGLFRREYEGETLRENLGLPRLEKQFLGASNDRPGARPDAALALRPFENG
jgi:hypothetical protein